MRIALLTTELPPDHAGGVGTYTATLAPALAARGHDVHVISTSPLHTDDSRQEDGVWWHRRTLALSSQIERHANWRQSILRLATMVSTVRTLRELRLRPDVIESPEWMAAGLPNELIRRVPTVVHLHMPLHLITLHNNVPFDRDRRLADLAERSTARRAAIVTSASVLLADELLARGWLQRRPEIIRCPVVVPARADEVTDAPPELLSVGRLEALKAPEVLIEAAAKLATEVPGIRVTFVGGSNGFKDGKPYGEWVRALADRLSVNARFIDHLPHDEVRMLYADARAVVVASRFESFSIAALEAMAAARPVICTETAGVSELVRGTSAGAVIPPGDPDALAGALRPFVDDRGHAASAGTAARTLVSDHCDPGLIAQQREACYLRAAGGA